MDAAAPAADPYALLDPPARRAASVEALVAAIAASAENFRRTSGLLERGHRAVVEDALFELGARGAGDALATIGRQGWIGPFTAHLASATYFAEEHAAGRPEQPAYPSRQSLLKKLRPEAGPADPATPGKRRKATPLPAGATPAERRAAAWLEIGLEADDRRIEARWPEVLAAFQLGRHVDAVVAAMMPAVALRIMPEGADAVVGASRVGGAPDLPADLPWPRDAEGAPLSFLAQVRLADLAGMPDAAFLPEDGLLSFFYGKDGIWKLDGPPGTWQALHLPAAASLVRRAPDVPRGVVAFSPRPLEAKALWTLVPAETPAWEALEAGLSRTALRHVEKFRKALPGLQAAPGLLRLLGHPTLIQEDRWYVDRFDPERPLLQAGSDPHRTGMMWGDMGIIRYMIRGSDLARRDFSRLRGDIECT